MTRTAADNARAFGTLIGSRVTAPESEELGGLSTRNTCRECGEPINADDIPTRRHAHADGLNHARCAAYLSRTDPEAPWTLYWWPGWNMTPPDSWTVTHHPADPGPGVARGEHWTAHPDTDHAAAEAWTAAGYTARFTCAHCDRDALWWFGGMPWNPARRYCSADCAADAKAEAQRARRAAERVTSATCAHCGDTFTPTRRDARYCATRCRVAAHRALLGSVTW